MWAMSLGGLVAGWIGLALVVSPSNVDDETLAGLLGLALAFLLASFYLVLRTAYDLARYKGRSPGIWVAVTLFFGLLAVGLLAVLDNLRLTQTGKG
jgi:drug/metabolite transporter (DMT)-like permease